MKANRAVSVAGVAVLMSGIFLGLTLLSRAQTQDTSGSAAVPQSQDSVVQIAAEAEGLALASPAQIPSDRCGTFWIVSDDTFAPYPFLPARYDLANTAIFSLDATGQSFLVDGTTTTNGMSAADLDTEGNMVLDLIARLQEAQMNVALHTTAVAMGLESDSEEMGGSFMIDTSGLWLEITNVTGGLAYLNLHNASNQVYSIWSTTNLSLPFADWQVETEVWPTNASVMPVTVATLNRETLFLYAMDWTGVNTNGLPAWWLWKWFGNFYEVSNNLDADGNTLQFDYLYGLDPSHVLFSLEFTNQYINTSATCGTLSVYGGYPYYVALLVNDTNTNDALWQPFTSTNVTIRFNSGTGTYNIGVGLKGFASNAQPLWQWDRLICLDIAANPWSLIINNPVSGNVSAPMIQLQGVVNRTLSQLTYDVSNALGVVTNQSGYWNASFYDTNVLAFTTNAFQCYDIRLTNGLNTITLHATDWEGNVVTTNISYILSYVGVTNVPGISIVWPQSTQVGGSNVTVQAQTDDATASFSASANGSSIQGLVDRNGAVWFQNVPLNAGTNVITITATNAAGNVNTTNLMIVQGPVSLTVSPIPDNQLNQSLVDLTGTVSDPSQNVWVNGVQAAVDGYGNWAATNVPVNSLGMAELHVQAGTGMNSVQSELVSDEVQPPTVTMLSYTKTYHDVDWSWNSWCMDKGPTIPYDLTTYWTSGNGQTHYHTIYWNGDNCPVPPVVEDGTTDLSGYIDDYPAPWLNANNSSYLDGFGLTRLNAETKLVIQPSGQKQTGAMDTYIVLVSALEYVVTDFYDLENLNLGYLTDVSNTPVPPGQITVSGQNVVATGITNANGTTWGLTSITAPAGADVPLTVAANLSNGNDAFVPQIQLAHLAIMDASSGVDFTMQTNNTVIVGQQMNLMAQLMSSNQVVTNLALANFQWTVPGNIFTDYVATAQSAVLYTNLSTTQSNVVFYWSDRGLMLVKCSATVEGKPVTGQAWFNVIRP
jgi:hypothetical protein